MKNSRYFSFLIVSVVFQSAGGVLGKYAALSIPVPTVPGILTNTFFILSVVCLVLQAVVWQQALCYFPLSVAYPCLSMTNFVVLFFSAVLFDETITAANMTGLFLVTAGIYILFYKPEEAA
jgi:multidrug transporter EmrE-like cation transporter